MATVHRQERSPYYFAFFRIPVGKAADGSIRWRLVKRSTKQKLRNNAVAAAVEMERIAMQEARADANESRKFVTVLREAVEDASRGLLTSAMARDYLERITEIATGETVQTHTVDGWFRSWLADKTRAKAKGTSVRYAGVIEAFLKSLPPGRKNSSVAGISVEDIRKFRDAELDAGKSAATANLAVKTISMTLGLAKRQGILKVNPAEAVDRIKTDSIEKDVFSADDVKKLIAAAKGDWKGVVLFAYFTGARLRDITQLTWKNIHLDRGTLSFTVAKTHKDLEIPLHPSVKEYLLERAATDDENTPVFLELVSKSTSGESGLSMAFSRIMAAARLVGKTRKAEGDKGRNRSSLTFHSLRHSFTSNLATAGVSAELRQKLTGHLDAKTHQRYTHHELETLERAVGMLPAL